MSVFEELLLILVIIFDFLFSRLHANLSIKLYFTNKVRHKSQRHCLLPTTDVILCEFHLTDV